MKELIGEKWAEIIGDEFSKQYMKDLSAFVVRARFQNTVYPDSKNVFTAYKLTPFDKVRVCILGQDPYINPLEAHGLAFSTIKGKSTPSLKQIERSIERDCYEGLNMEWDNNLERWTEQGVFLLNTILTVDAGASLSHQNKGWETFTAKTILELSRRGDIVFLLWGAYAKAYSYMIDPVKNTILTASHPVSASYNGTIWDNGDCFNKVNQLIKGDKIIW